MFFGGHYHSCGQQQYIGYLDSFRAPSPQIIMDMSSLLLYIGFISLLNCGRKILYHLVAVSLPYLLLLFSFNVLVSNHVYDISLVMFMKAFDGSSALSSLVVALQAFVKFNAICKMCSLPTAKHTPHSSIGEGFSFLFVLELHILV